MNIKVSFVLFSTFFAQSSVLASSSNQLEARRLLIESNARGDSVHEERWIASIEQVGPANCELLARALSSRCTPAGNDSQPESLRSSFDNLCVVEFSCSESMVFDGALDDIVDPADLERATVSSAFDFKVKDVILRQGNDSDDDIAASNSASAYVGSLARANKGWNLERISAANPMAIRSSNASQFFPRYQGNGVNVYVLDTGVKVDHETFRTKQGAQRVVQGLNAIPSEVAHDIHGHGTHCAGTVGGVEYGAAPNATIVAVKVANLAGDLESGSLIRGLKWSIDHQRKTQPGKAAVFSMSLRTNPSKAIDRATKNAAKSGHIVVVAAGNDVSDSCYFSPQRLGGKHSSVRDHVINVMSSDITDTLSSFSNFGTCSDIVAPGSNILSAGISSTNATQLMSGTSMATPLVAGVAAQLLEKHNFNKKKAQNELFNLAIRNHITMPTRAKVTNSPNLLLQMPMF